jgi:tetratricopeptide (TPR) repeat protein
MMISAALRRDVTNWMRQGNFPAAVQAIESVLIVAPEDVETLSLAAAIYARSGQFPDAVRCAQAVLMSKDSHLNLTLPALNALALSGHHTEAVRAAGGIDITSLTDPRHCDQLGQIYTICEHHSEAERCFQRTVDLAPDVPPARFNLAASQRFLGKLDVAEAHLDQVIEAQGTHFEALYARSGLRRQTADSNHVDELRDRLKAGDLPRYARVQLGYALGKELEDLEDWDGAFKAYAGAGAQMKSLMNYSVQSELSDLDGIIAHHTNATCPANSAPAERLHPVFVLGLPRAGSTLVERILAAHPAIATAGELDDFAAAIVSATPNPAGNMASNSAQADPALIGNGYLEALTHRGFTEGRVIDKMPLNFLYVGLILSCLPGARIIHVHRDPMDALLATYKTLFRDRYRWSYGLSDAAAFIVGYRKLMAHWDRQYGDRILHLCYEDLVADPETTARCAIDYLDLEWDPACLEFHQRSEAVTTASASQVREAIHDRSVGKWKHFESVLGDFQSHFPNKAD